VSPTTRPALGIAIPLLLVLAGGWLWSTHAGAWDVGRLSPVLNYDTSQYALAARELAEHGRLATPFALPIELGRAGHPPWPLAVVQPGLVVAEAAIFRLVPSDIRIGDRNVVPLTLPYQREWLTLFLPFFCYLAIAVLLAAVTATLLERHAPASGSNQQRVAAVTVALAFLLDPEAQHFAVGGFTELPFTLGLAAAMSMLLAEHLVVRRPLLFGLLLGVTGSFRASALWLAPILAVSAAAMAPGRRLRVLALVMLGFALPLAPWWFYKWRTFGSPGWDLSSLVVWEGVQGRTWFSLYHLPDFPTLPHGMEAVGLLAAKVGRRLPGLLLALVTGPRALWTGALVLWLVTCRPPRTLAITAMAILAGNLLSLLAAAASIPWLRFLFPTRVLLEAAGLLALWGIIARAPSTLMGPRFAAALKIGVAALAIGWGIHQTLRGNVEARATAGARGVPSVPTMQDLGDRLRRQVPASEVVMSNLGPMLSWYSGGRPVIHLARTPADMGACRQKLEFRHVLVAFREVESAWPEWQELVAGPQEAPRHPEWNVYREQHWREEDGFQIIWLELGPPEATLARRGR
jgi:hypothetical protein